MPDIQLRHTWRKLDLTCAHVCPHCSQYGLVPSHLSLVLPPVQHTHVTELAQNLPALPSHLLPQALTVAAQPALQRVEQVHVVGDLEGEGRRGKEGMDGVGILDML